jgi:hypothetical protein
MAKLRVLFIGGTGNYITVDQHPQRLAREALFLLVFGSRPGIKNPLLDQLGRRCCPLRAGVIVIRAAEHVS